MLGDRWRRHTVGDRVTANPAAYKLEGGDLPAPIYYLAGPPAMVEAVRQTLNRASINDDDIRSEEFFGY